MAQPKNVPINFVPATKGETFALGTMTIRILEDGSNTGNATSDGIRDLHRLSYLLDNRLGAVELIIPPNTPGPPAHWHEMHDETFLVTKGIVRFHTEGHGDVDAKEGDYVVVPIRAPHTFSNPTDEESRFFNTFTPAFYINYFKMLGQMLEKGKPMSPDINKAAMASYATLVVEK